MLSVIRPIGSILIALAVLFFFVRPIFADITRIGEESREYREVVGKITDLNNHLGELIEQKESFGSYELERIDALVPPRFDELRALVDLQAIAEREGLVFRATEVALGRTLEGVEGEQGSEEIVEVAEGLQGNDITFHVLGTYEQFKAFVRELEQSLVRKEIVKITFTQEAGELTDYEVTIRLFALASVGESQPI